MSKRRVVFDTSTLVSAALRNDSIPYKALFLGLDLYEVWASEETLNELDSVLMRSKFDKRISSQSRLDFLSLMQSETRSIRPEKSGEQLIFPSCRDAKDNKFLLLAVTAKAEAIVSSDNDLLVLNPWNGIAILTPAEFLEQFQGR